MACCSSCFISAYAQVIALEPDEGIEVSPQASTIGLLCHPLSDQFSPGSSFPLASVHDDRLVPIPRGLSRYRCRNNQLLATAMEKLAGPLQALQNNGVNSRRVGVVIGTSASGIRQGEAALAEFYRQGRLAESFHYKQQEIGGAAEFIAAGWGFQGPAYSIASSCAASAHALHSARNLLRLGLCDAVIAGGAETFSGTTVQGFAALGALSRRACNPFSGNRDGTVLGEGAALFLLTRASAPLAMLGVGMTTDAYHLSAPDPTGQGAKLAMERALADAGIAPEQIGYLNLHGTATRHNDAMEARAVSEIFGKAVPCSATKPVTGHCLGASGAVELALCAGLLQNPARLLPIHRWDGCADPELPPLNFVEKPQTLDPDRPFCMSNTYAFGGANVSLVIGRTYTMER